MNEANKMERLRRLREKLAATPVDGMVINNGENRRYLSGFTGSAGMVVIDARAAYLVTDFRYWEQAAAEAHGFTICKQGPDIYQSVIELIGTLQWRTVGFEPESLTYLEYQKFDRLLPATVQFLPVPEVVRQLRAVKDAAEIKLLAEAARITDRAWQKTLTVIKPGVRETEVALEFDYQLRVNGAEDSAFPTIVASGARTALPHGAPTAKKIIPGELVLIDGGAKYQGYHGDMTRTVVLGPATARQRELYQMVLTAQKKALGSIKAGLTGKALDAVARQEIAVRGYGEYFGHGLGHSVGLNIHESPRLSPLENSLIPVGATVTVEPGIYLPEWGGIRIEDLVVVEADGIRNLTGSPKEELIELG
jgi:Xaa-Pro aminopeptidase